MHNLLALTIGAAVLTPIMLQNTWHVFIRPLRDGERLIERVRLGAAMIAAAFLITAIVIIVCSPIVQAAPHVIASEQAWAAVSIAFVAVRLTYRRS
jgi:hypothetical protein